MANYSKTEWLKTTAIYTFHDSMGVKLGSVQSGAVFSTPSGIGWDHSLTCIQRVAGLGQKVPEGFTHIWPLRPLPWPLALHVASHQPAV